MLCMSHWLWVGLGLSGAGEEWVWWVGGNFMQITFFFSRVGGWVYAVKAQLGYCCARRKEASYVGIWSRA